MEFGMSNQAVSSPALQRAQAYEKEAGRRIPAGQKPSFHVSAPVGWINDPNGFSCYGGEYHLFYQYHPYDTKWGPMHWGHSKTKDFIKWEQLPAALAPDTAYDGQGCFSGSALEHDGKHILMYTGVLEKPLPVGGRLIRQTQCIAVGDGLHYEKLACNPVITADLLPEGSSQEDFRDPRIWWEEEKQSFYAVVGSRSEDGSGQIVLFSSPDVQSWKQEGIVERSCNEYGAMWECPDFFMLDGRQVLLTSPQDMEAQGLEFHNGNCTLYLLGGGKHPLQFKREAAGAIDYGLDFYAPQTVETADGRRVMIGWMQSWDNYITPSAFAWSGILSIPRELHIEDNHLIQNPVRELERYYQDTVDYQGIVPAQATQLAGVEGRQIDMTVWARGEQDFRLQIELACDNRHAATLTYDAKDSTLTFDRTRAGIRRDVLHRRTVRVDGAPEAVKLRIVMDIYTVEVFVNDGRQAMSSLIYTPPQARGIRFAGTGELRMDLVKHSIVTE